MIFCSIKIRLIFWLLNVTNVINLRISNELKRRSFLFYANVSLAHRAKYVMNKTRQLSVNVSSWLAWLSEMSADELRRPHNFT